MSSIDHSVVVEVLDIRQEPSSVNPSPDSSPANSWEVKLSTSVSTLPSSPSVKFAPLPELAPWKRRSTVPLGVAARAQLMRRQQDRGESRRGAQKQQYHPTVRHGSGPGRPRVGGSRNRESFVALGKVVKGVWRRVAKKGDGRLEGRGAAAVDERNVTVELGGPDSDVDPMGLEEEDGTVWEDGVRVQFREDVSQTETVRDNSAYTWSTVIRPIKQADGGQL